MKKWTFSDAENGGTYLGIIEFQSNDEERVSEKYPEISLLEISMDITATHCNGCRLDLGRLLAAEDFDFFHDVGMIRRNLNRSTGKLENHCLPRFAII